MRGGRACSREGVWRLGEEVFLDEGWALGSQVPDGEWMLSGGLCSAIDCGSEQQAHPPRTLSAEPRWRYLSVVAQQQSLTSLLFPLFTHKDSSRVLFQASRESSLLFRLERGPGIALQAMHVLSHV